MSTTVLSQFKVSALPGTLVANAIYYVGVASNPNLLEIYVTDSVGTASRHVINSTEIATMISQAIGSSNQLNIVANIAERNALSTTSAIWCYVVDATSEPDIDTGGATYLYNPTSSSWIKTSEAESMDLLINWASIANKPVSTVAQIDTAVVSAHTHTNKTQLDKVGESGGNFTYNAALPVSRWESAQW